MEFVAKSVESDSIGAGKKGKHRERASAFNRNDLQCCVSVCASK